MKSTCKTSSTAAFSTTKFMFRDFMDGKTTFSYSEWKHLSADCKAAALYLNFYDTIMANLYRARLHKPIPGSDDDLVSVALEKCNRIVSVLESEPEKYTKGYVSLVMYNAFATDLSQLVSSKQKQFDVFSFYNFSDLIDSDELVNDDNIVMKVIDEPTNLTTTLDKLRIEQITDSQPQYVREIIEKIMSGGKLGKKQKKLLPYLREIFAEFNPNLVENNI